MEQVASGSVDGGGTVHEQSGMDASQRTAALEQSLSEARGELERARAELERAQRGRELDAALIEAGAVDLETARLVAEGEWARQTGRSAAEVVGEAARRKPFLFRRARREVSAGFGSERAPAEREREEAAHEALATGDRGALLRYLRARRNGVGV